MIHKYMALFAVVFGPVLVMAAMFLARDPAPEGALGYHIFALILAGFLIAWALDGLVLGPKHAPTWLGVVSMLWNLGLGVAQFMHRPWTLTGEQFFDGFVCFLWVIWFL